MLATGGSLGPGAVVWYCGLALNRYLLHQCPLNFHCCQVLELGSGTGLEGLTAAAMGGDVRLTDQQLLLPLLDQNVSDNEQLVRQAGGSVKVLCMDWGEWGNDKGGGVVAVRGREAVGDKGVVAVVAAAADGAVAENAAAAAAAAQGAQAGGGAGVRTTAGLAEEPCPAAAAVVLGSPAARQRLEGASCVASATSAAAAVSRQGAPMASSSAGAAGDAGGGNSAGLAAGGTHTAAASSTTPLPAAAAAGVQRWVLGADLVYSSSQIKPLVGTLGAVCQGHWPWDTLGHPGETRNIQMAAATQAGAARNNHGSSSSRSRMTCTGEQQQAGQRCGLCQGQHHQHNNHDPLQGYIKQPQTSTTRERPCASGVQVLMAHKARHPAVDCQLQEALLAAGFEVEVIAQYKQKGRRGGEWVGLWRGAGAAGGLGLGDLGHGDARVCTAPAADASRGCGDSRSSVCSTVAAAAADGVGMSAPPAAAVAGVGDIELVEGCEAAAVATARQQSGGARRCCQVTHHSSIQLWWMWLKAMDRGIASEGMGSVLGRQEQKRGGSSSGKGQAGWGDVQEGSEKQQAGVVGGMQQQPQEQQQQQLWLLRAEQESDPIRQGLQLKAEHTQQDGEKEEQCQREGQSLTIGCDPLATTAADGSVLVQRGADMGMKAGDGGYRWQLAEQQKKGVYQNSSSSRTR